MPRRWSVATQLLALQLGIIAVVLVGVGAVPRAQAQADFRRTGGSRVPAAAENLAARAALRQALEASVPTPVEYLVPAVPNLVTYLGPAGGLGIAGCSSASEVRLRRGVAGRPQRRYAGRGRWAR